MRTSGSSRLILCGRLPHAELSGIAWPPAISTLLNPRKRHFTNPKMFLGLSQTILNNTTRSLDPKKISVELSGSDRDALNRKMFFDLSGVTWFWRTQQQTEKYSWSHTSQLAGDEPRRS
jgi:hypothetical protein